MMLRYIIWMIIVYVAAKIIGQLVRSIRLIMTPNRDVLRRNAGTPIRGEKKIEDIPYEEIKEQ